MKTTFQKQKQKRDQAIAARLAALMATEGAMKTACEQVVMREFSIHSRSTVQAICRRVESQNQPRP